MSGACCLSIRIWRSIRSLEEKLHLEITEAHCTSVLELSVDSSCPTVEWAASEMRRLLVAVGRCSPFREVCGEIPILGGNGVDNYSNSEDFLLYTE